MGYIKYWNLKEKPFEEVCDTRFYFESEDHQEALDRMLYVVNDRNMNMGLLTGEVGSGKTITKNVFEGSLPQHSFEVISFENSNFPFTDIVYDIIRRITFRDSRLALFDMNEMPARSDKYMLMQTFRNQLETLHYEEKRHLVVVFDEAQLIEDSVLDDVKNLTNFSSQQENFLTIFLVGQPELREKVRFLKQVDQRIFLRFHLNNLDYDGTVKYIQHRLRVSGLERNTIFTIEAYESIYRITGGVPRQINRLCKLALNYGFAHECSEIGHDDIAVIYEDIRSHS